MPYLDDVGMSDRDIPVVILCGGRGMRLNERTESVPKPLVEIGGMPVLWHVMKIFSASGFRNFVLCLGYRGDQIRDYFIRLPQRSFDCTLRLRGADASVVYHQDVADDWDITFVDTGERAETGLRLRRVEEYVSDASAFFVTYADGLSDVPLAALLSSHRASGRVATMTCVRPRTHFGLVKVGESGAITAYEEKPHLPALVNGGFFCFNREVFRYLLDGDVALEREPLQRLIVDRQLMAHPYDGFWACMDTYKDNQELCDLWARGKAPWRVW